LHLAVVDLEPSLQRGPAATARDRRAEAQFAQDGEVNHQFAPSDVDQRQPGDGGPPDRRARVAARHRSRTERPSGHEEPGPDPKQVRDLDSALPVYNIR
jgi:hypothetical protein